MALKPEEFYIMHSDRECERLELQAEVADITDHLRHFANYTPEAILDVGCGSGSMTRLLAARYPQAPVVGLDFMPQYLNYARKRAAREGLANVTFEQGDAQDLGFANGSFNLIWSKYLLYFLPRPEDAIREFYRVMRPGGVIVIALNDYHATVFEPDENDVGGRFLKVAARAVDASLLARLPAMLMRAGFSHVSVTVDTERVYTTVGRAGPRMREHLEMEILGARSVIADVVGGEAECEAFIVEYLNYFDRHDTSVVMPLWFVKARVANAALPDGSSHINHQ